jgi:hypothetical protein
MCTKALMNSIIKWRAVLAGVLVIGSSLALGKSTRADATGLTGDQLTLTYYYPNLSTPYTTGNFAPVTFTVAGGTEVSNFGISGSGDFSVTANDTTITIQFLDNTTFTSQSFNGVVFSGTGLGITGVSLDPSSVITADVNGNSLTVNPTSDANDVYINWAGPELHDTLVFDVAADSLAPAPEPASMVLFGTGLLGIIFVMGKRLFA